MWEAGPYRTGGGKGVADSGGVSVGGTNSGNLGPCSASRRSGNERGGRWRTLAKAEAVVGVS